MFEKASRMKLRFATHRGSLTAEDLWDLPLTSNTGKVNLDDIARGLHQQIKDTAEVSFVNPSESKDEGLELGFAIVKHVIAVRLAENEAKSKREAARAEKQKLLELLQNKKDEGLKNLSEAELEAKINELQSLGV